MDTVISCNVGDRPGIRVTPMHFTLEKQKHTSGPSLIPRLMWCWAVGPGQSTDGGGQAWLWVCPSCWPQCPAVPVAFSGLLGQYCLCLRSPFLTSLLQGKSHKDAVLDVRSSEGVWEYEQKRPTCREPLKLSCQPVPHWVLGLWAEHLK